MKPGYIGWRRLHERREIGGGGFGEEWAEVMVVVVVVVMEEEVDFLGFPNSTLVFGRIFFLFFIAFSFSFSSVLTLMFVVLEH